MEDFDRIEPTDITRDELPATISAYLNAREAGDLDAATAQFTTHGVVTDEGHGHSGVDEIRAWMSHSASEYTYTITLSSAHKIDDQRYDVVQHLEGDFPGGVVDLHFRFTLRDALIAQLTIEP